MQQKPQPPIFIFDIETVPDIPLLYLNYQDKLLLKEPFNEQIHWNNYSFLEEFREQTKIDFPQTIYHCVLSICGVFVDPYSFQIVDGFKRTLTKASSYEDLRSQEKTLLQDFWNFSIKYKDLHKDWFESKINDRYLSEYQKNKLRNIPVTFCGYNITNFDLMVIEQRSLIHFITCPIDDYVKNLGNDSYRYKYASDKVFDLMNFISNYDNRNAKVGLNILAKAMGIGGKMHGMDGGKVAFEYYENNASAKIEEYCSIDVLVSYAVFLSIQKFRGIIDEELFRKCLNWFEQWLLKEGKPSSYRELARESHIFFNYAKEGQYNG